MDDNNNGSLQVSRWAFTLNNPVYSFNYKDHLMQEEFSVKRAIVGYEIGGENNIPHLQGYIEFLRTKRLCFVRRILPTAHWTRVISSASNNLKYCSKDNRFFIIGNFDKEFNLMKNINFKSCSSDNGVILKQLLDSEHCSQLVSNMKYVRNKKGFDSMADTLLNLQYLRDLYSHYYFLLLRHTLGE